MNTTGKMVCIANMLFVAVAVSLSGEEPNVTASRANSTTADARIADRYAVEKLYDGDPRTSWVEGQVDDGIGEWVEISIDPQAEIDTIEVMPGYFNERFWSLNNRVARMRISLTGDGGTESIEHTFRDEMMPQRIEIGSRRVSKIQLEILAVFRGERWRDTCIAEIGFYRGDSRIPLWTNPDVARTPPVDGALGMASQFSSFSWYFYRDGTFLHSMDDPMGRPLVRLKERGIWSFEGDTLELNMLLRTGRRGEGAYEISKDDKGPGSPPGTYERYVDFTEWTEETLVEKWGDVVKSRGRTVAGPYYPGPYDKP